MTDLTETLRRYYAAWSQQDPEAVLQFFAPDSVFEDLAFEARFEGTDQIRSFIELTYAGVPDFKVVPVSIVTDGVSAAASWTMSGTHSGNMPSLPATGKTFEVRASSMVTVRDEKILTIVDHWNPVAFKRCVGLA